VGEDRRNPPRFSGPGAILLGELAGWLKLDPANPGPRERTRTRELSLWATPCRARLVTTLKGLALQSKVHGRPSQRLRRLGEIDKLLAEHRKRKEASGDA
jgi:hypothetical protein